MQSPSANSSLNKALIEDNVSLKKEDAAPRLLFIDDDRAILDGYRFIFEGEGFRVDVATDSKSALELVKKHSYSIIVMDYILPGVKGDDLAEQIQEINSSISLIFISGQKSAEEELQRRGIFVSGFFMKPLKTETLIDFIVSTIQIID
jgi:DNA-binding response OmpR family regulator